MKRMYILWVVVAALVVAGGLLFVFGDVLLDDGNDYENVPVNDTAKVSVTIEDGEVEDKRIGSSGSSGETGDGDGIEEDVELNCRTREIQYSLKNFREEIVCRKSGAEGCEELAVSCSLEVYNLDDADGVFEIEYGVADSDDRELDSVVIEKNVASDDFEVFSADFVVTENVDEDSSCILDMKSVPLIEVCN